MNEQTTHSPPDLIRNSAWLGGAQLIGWLTTPVVLLLIARRIGVDALGLYVFAAALWATAGVLIDLGLETNLVRLAANAEPKVRTTLAAGARAVGTAWLTLSLLIATTYLILWVVGLRPTGAFEVVGPLLCIVGVQALAERLGGLYNGVLRGNDQMRAIALIDGVTKLLTLGLVLATLAVSADIRAVAAAHLVTALLRLALLARSAGKILGPPDPTHPGQSSWNLVKRSTALLLFHLVVMIYAQVDIVMLAFFVDSEAMGWYAAAERLFTTSMFAVNILAGAAFATFTRLGSDREQLLALARRAITVLTVAAGGLGLGLAATSSRVVPLLFGSDFDESAPILLFFALALPATYVLAVLAVIALATGQERFWLKLQTAGLVATIALNLVLIPLAEDRFVTGALAGAWTTLLVELAMLPMAFRKIIPGFFDRQVIQLCGRIAFASAIMVAVVLMLDDAPLVVPVALGAATYLGLLQVTGGLPIAEFRQLRTGS